MRKLFKSVLNPDTYGLVLDSDSYSMGETPQVHCQIRRFDTLGDGMTAHTPDYNIPRTGLLDWLLSAAAYLAETRETDAASVISWILVPVESPAIAFASTVQHKEFEQWDKRRYYSLSEKKVSTAGRLRHDKRYEETQSWMDGSPESTSRILYKAYWDFFTVYCSRECVREWMIEHRDEYWQMPLSTMGDAWQEAGNARDVHNAYRHLRDIATAIKTLDAATANINSLTESLRQRELQESAA
jgi:hypothetical protein